MEAPGTIPSAARPRTRRCPPSTLTTRTGCCEATVAMVAIVGRAPGASRVSTARPAPRSGPPTVDSGRRVEVDLAPRARHQHSLAAGRDHRDTSPGCDPEAARKLADLGALPITATTSALAPAATESNDSASESIGPRSGTGDGPPERVDTGVDPGSRRGDLRLGGCHVLEIAGHRIGFPGGEPEVIGKEPGPEAAGPQHPHGDGDARSGQRCALVRLVGDETPIGHLADHLVGRRRGDPEALGERCQTERSLVAVLGGAEMVSRYISSLSLVSG